MISVFNDSYSHKIREPIHGHLVYTTAKQRVNRATAPNIWLNKIRYIDDNKLNVKLVAVSERKTDPVSTQSVGRL